MRCLAIHLYDQQVREIGLLEQHEELARPRRLDMIPIERQELIPGCHHVDHADVFVAAVIRRLQELHGPLALDVVGGDEAHQALFLGDQQRANAQADHVTQGIIDLPLGIHGHRIVALEIGERVDRGIAQFERAPVEDRATRQHRVAELSHRQE